MQVNIVPTEYKLVTKNGDISTIRTIPMVIEERKSIGNVSIHKQGFIKPDKLVTKPSTGAATLNRKTNPPKNMQRRLSCPVDIYDQIYEDIEVSNLLLLLDMFSCYLIQTCYPL